MKSVVLIGLCAAICFGADAVKPRCTKKINGQFWPLEANSDPQALRRFTQSGELEMCAIGRWKYRWEAVSVNVRNLGKGKKAEKK